MVRILELITLGEIGGAQTVLVDLVKGISDRGYKVEIDVVFGAGEYLPQALNPWFRGQAAQMPLLGREINLYKDFMTLLQLKKLFREREYDIIHCHSSKASWLGRIAATWAGIPNIYMTVHGTSFHPGTSPLVRKIYKQLEKVVIPFASEYIFVSPNDLEEMKSLGLDASKCRLIPNGRPVPPPPGEGLRELLAIPEDTPVACMVARLSKVKNPMALVRIAEIVIRQYPRDLLSPKFVLIGDGPMFDQCHSAIRKAGLEDSIYMVGHKEEASQYFWDADVAILTSDYEACPLVAIEAMATGTPVIASNVGGTGHVVSHGQTGYLYSSNNEEEAAQYLLNLLTDKELRVTMGNKALEFYQEEFTMERMVDHYVKLFGL